jgi:DNA-binding FadR family transcriptional regulator
MNQKISVFQTVRDTAPSNNIRPLDLIRWVRSEDQKAIVDAIRSAPDKDNAAAMCKAYLDGIADAVQQDDSDWEFDGVRFDIDRDNPRLEIVFTEL